MRALIGRDGHTTPLLVEVPDLTPGPGQVVVRTAAATVNPIDTNVARGAAREAFGISGDVGLGWDFAGVVEAVGDGVTDVQPGQRVAGLTGNPTDPLRAQAEQVLASADALAPIPDALSDAEAASMPLNALTAAQMVALLGPGEGRSLLVAGAAGAVGGYLLPLAREAGWQVTGLARESDREFVTGQGAQLVTELPGPEFDAVADAATLQQGAIGAVRDGGTFVGVLPQMPVPSERGIEVKAVFVQADGEELAGLLRRAATGELVARVAQEVAFDEYLSAYEHTSAPSGRRGRSVLVF